MPRLACRRCDRLLTQECEWGSPEQRNAEAQDGEPATPAGLMIAIAEDCGEVTQDGRTRTVVISPAGALAVHPESLVPGALISSGWDNGCCGSDGMDGPNRSCVCGNVVGTEWSDCWTFAEVRFHPDAVTVRER